MYSGRIQVRVWWWIQQIRRQTPYDRKTGCITQQMFDNSENQIGFRHQSNIELDWFSLFHTHSINPTLSISHTDDLSLKRITNVHIEFDVNNTSNLAAWNLKWVWKDGFDCTEICFEKNALPSRVLTRILLILLLRRVSSSHAAHFEFQVQFDANVCSSIYALLEAQMRNRFYDAFCVRFFSFQVWEKLNWRESMSSAATLALIFFRQER